jgi:hypothetical protein
MAVWFLWRPVGGALTGVDLQCVLRAEPVGLLTLLIALFCIAASRSYWSRLLASSAIKTSYEAFNRTRILSRRGVGWFSRHNTNHFFVREVYRVLYCRSGTILKVFFLSSPGESVLQLNIDRIAHAWAVCIVRVCTHHETTRLHIIIAPRSGSFSSFDFRRFLIVHDRTSGVLDLPFFVQFIID